jgi:hypothetical protein
MDSNNPRKLEETGFSNEEVDEKTSSLAYLFSEGLQDKPFVNPLRGRRRKSD